MLFGVECRDMLDKIQCDLSISDNIHYGNPVSLHPLNKDRSKHFIKTLFEHWNSKGSTGNLILNCGLNHNNHIVEFIEDDHIENITGVKANYIRLNTIK